MCPCLIISQQFPMSLSHISPEGTSESLGAHVESKDLAVVSDVPQWAVSSWVSHLAFSVLTDTMMDLTRRSLRASLALIQNRIPYHHCWVPVPLRVLLFAWRRVRPCQVASWETRRRVSAEPVIFWLFQTWIPEKRQGRAWGRVVEWFWNPHFLLFLSKSGVKLTSSNVNVNKDDSGPEHVVACCWL